MIEFSRCPFQIVEDNFHLIEQHWQEVVSDKRDLAPHWEFFREAEKGKHLICFSAKNGDELAGYAVFLIQPDLHSRHTLLAYNDAVFMRRDCRKNGTGKAFLEYCDQELAKSGINLILWHVKPKRDFSGVLKTMGYQEFSTIYGRNVSV